jgi:hypothetical protein
MIRIRAAQVAVLLTASVLVAGCSSGHQPAAPNTHGPTNDPRTVAAAKVAVEAVDRQLSGDYAGAWELYTTAGKAAISKDDFVRLQAACPPKDKGQQARALEGRLQDPNTAVIRLQVAGSTAARTLRNESGQWRIEPSDSAMADFKLGVDQAITKERAAGNCPGTSSP